MNQPDPRAHALDRMLDEQLNADLPPDLSQSIFDRAQRLRADAMATSEPGDPTMPDNSFESVAVDNAPRGLLGEFCGFMADNSKWWLTPFLIVFGLLGLVVLLGSTGAAPFIYTMF